MASHEVPNNEKAVAAKRMKAKICLVGEAAVGKTSLIRRYVKDVFSDEYIATMGTKVTKKDVEILDDRYGHVQVNLIIWDIMGDKGFRELLREAFFQGAKAIMAVCDVTRSETLSEMRTWIQSVSKVAGTVPTQILANKIDLEQQMEFDENDVKRMSESYESGYLLTSAKTGENVEKAFVEIARAIVERKAGSTSTWDKQIPSMASYQPQEVARKV